MARSAPRIADVINAATLVDKGFACGRARLGNRALTQGPGETALRLIAL